MKNFFSIKKDNVCPHCGEKLIDDFCSTCNRYSSAETVHKKLKEKHPNIRCKCKSKKIEFSIEEDRTPTPKNFIDKAALNLIEKYNQKYPQDVPQYREVARCKKCGNKWYVDGYRDNNKIMVSARNAFLILLLVMSFVLIITIGTIKEKSQQDFETTESKTTSQISTNSIEESVATSTEVSTTIESATSNIISSTSDTIDDYWEIGTDREIVLKENHPKYLDDVEVATNIWEYEIAENKVVINGLDNSLHNRNHIIEMDITEDEQSQRYISYIEIYFSRFDETISFDDALNIVATYLPKEIIQQHYIEEASFSEPRDSGNGTLYTKSYVLSDDSSINVPKAERYLTIMVWVDKNGQAEEARIDSYGSSDFDDETMNKWNYDFFTISNENSTTETTKQIITTETTVQETETTKKGRIVYVTPYGEKYHFSSNCAGKSAIERDYNDVEGIYDPCKKCAY